MKPVYDYTPSQLRSVGWRSFDWRQVLDDLIEEGLVDPSRRKVLENETQWAIGNPKRSRVTTQVIIEKLATAILATQKARLADEAGMGVGSPKLVDWLTPDQWRRRIKREAYRGHQHDDTWRAPIPPHSSLSPHLMFVNGRVHATRKDGGLVADPVRPTGLRTAHPRHEREVMG